MKKIPSFLMLILLHTSLLTVAFSDQLDKTTSTITIVPDDFEKIQWALGNASDGDTIFVRAGVYDENISWDYPIGPLNNVLLQGESKFTTIINGSVQFGHMDYGGNNTIRGLQLGGLGGYRIYPLSTIDDCVMLSGMSFNDAVISLKNNFISGNITSSRGQGHIDYIEMINNTLSGTSIIPEGPYGGINMVNNTIVNSKAGIDAKFGYVNIVAIENRFLNCTYGVKLVGIGDHQYTFQRNYFENCVYGAMFSPVEWLYGNMVGNTFTANSYGVYLTQSGGSMSFSQNNFLHNDVQAEVIGTIESPFVEWNSSYPTGGNYWSDYQGPDVLRGPYQNETGSDGIIDSPYFLSVNSTDYFPLSKPFSGEPDIGLKMSLSRSLIAQDSNLTLSIEITILNYGMQQETINFTFQLDQVTLQQIFSLSGRNSTLLSIAWNTTGVAKGNYTSYAYVEPLTGEVDIADNLISDRWILVTLPGDVDGDRDVDIFDIVAIASVYGCYDSDPAYNQNYDIDGDGDIDIFDIVAAAGHYGESW